LEHAESQHGSAAHGGTTESTGHEGGFGTHPIWDVGGYQLNSDTLIATWMVMAILVAIALIAGRNLQRVPNKVQSLFESVVEAIESIIHSQIGPNTSLYLSYIGTLFLFVLISNWSAFLPSLAVFQLAGVHGMHELAPPTSDLNTTGALALIALVSYFVFGIKAKGIRYFKHYVTPHWAMLPLNLLEDFTRPMSLAFRLFGNIMGEHIVASILLLLVPFIVPVPMMLLGSLFGFIQAYIFATLTAFYIGSAVQEHGHGDDHGHGHGHAPAPAH